MITKKLGVKLSRGIVYNHLVYLIISNVQCSGGNGQLRIGYTIKNRSKKNLTKDDIVEHMKKNGLENELPGSYIYPQSAWDGNGYVYIGSDEYEVNTLQIADVPNYSYLILAGSYGNNTSNSFTKNFILYNITDMMILNQKVIEII